MDVGMLERKTSNYPKRDLTPEHTKRVSEDHGSNDDAPLHPEISAAYDYVHSVLDTSDYEGRWYGWALREVFLAGVSHAQKQGNNMETLDCDVCGAKITDFENDLFHFSGKLKNKISGHIHLCAKCKGSLNPTLFDFDEALVAQLE